MTPPPSTSMPADLISTAVAEITPAETSLAPAAGKNPLELLEEILQKSKASAGNPAEEAAAVAAADQVAREQRAADQTAEDNFAIAQEVKDLSSIKDTPAYQARAKQLKAEKIAQAETKAESQAFQIHQLGHTKVEVDNGSTV